MSEVIQFNEVSFSFPDEEPIIRDFSMSILSGERVVITGPSGCGKSTLLYLCNRLYPENCDGIVTGSIELFGKQNTSYHPGEINRRVATVFQDPDAQFCMQTVEQELAFTLENLEVPQKEMQMKIDHILTVTGLEKVRHAIIQSLSGGWKQRVATACALIMEPDILLLDEPLAHLDPMTAQQFVAWLDQLDSQMTIVAIEHRLDLWGDFFDREIPLVKSKARMVLPRREHLVSDIEALTVQELQTDFLQPATFSLKKGEIAVLAGPNGGGKSTLLKAMGGLLPSKGNVQPLDLGYVPQSPEFLFITKTVKEEVAYGGGSSVEDILHRLRLSTISEAHPFAISHGQKRRLAIAIMLCDDREIILMDEPTSGQDQEALNELFELIEERANEGATFFIVTHDMDFAASIADSVLLIKEGKLSEKLISDDVWRNEELLESYSLLPPKGVRTCEKVFIT